MREFWKFHDIVEFAKRASLKFDEPNVFNTASFIHAISDEIGFIPTHAQDQIIAALEGCPKIVKLSGGCHWFLLPRGHERFIESP